MKLTELLVKQKIAVQLVWGEQIIEFQSEVVENDGASVYVSPYLHNGGPLTINIIPEKGVICNVYTTDPTSKQRLSWKNIELTTTTRNDEMVYCMKTGGHNASAKQDERRAHERITIQLKGRAYVGPTDEEGVEVLIHDISDVGVSFYAPASFAPKIPQMFVEFSDVIDDKEFNVRVEGTITRTGSKAGNTFVACKIAGPNKEYHLYGFLRRLKERSKY